MKKFCFSTLIITFIIVISFVLFDFFYSDESIIRIPITYSSSGLPLVTAKIQNETFLVTINLSNVIPFSLNKKYLDSLSKKPYKTLDWKEGSHDEHFQAPSFLIPKIAIEGLVLKDVVTVADSDGEIQGTLGTSLLEKVNLLFDFPSSVMFACQNKESIKKAGFSIKSTTHIPAEFTPDGIIVKVGTDAGVLRLALSTGVSHNLIRTSHAYVQKDQIIDNEGLHSIFSTSKFLIGGRDFGHTDLILYDLPPEIDGFLGMAFLEKYVIYIDYRNQAIYIGDSK